MVAAPTLQRISVEDAVTRYLRNVERAVAGHSLSPATAANYRRDLTEFIRLAGAEVILDDLDAETLDDIVLAYSSTPDGRFKDPTKTRGPGATSRFRQSMSRLFTEALAAGWIEHNPVPQMRVKPKQPPLATAARKALPATAAAALVAHRPGDDVEGRTDQRLDLRDRFLLMLFMEGGPRVSEVCRANRSDLEVRDDGSVWLTLLGKGGKVRQIPLSAATYAAWLDYEQNARPAPTARTHARADGRVIETAPVGDAEAALVLTWRGKRMTPRDIQLMVARHCRRLPASVRRDVTPHGLRHTAATLLLSSGAADVNTVREILGHASLATTGIYLDGIDDDKRRAVAAHPITSRTATS